MKYQRYPKYKDGGIGWIGEIPEHWDVTRARWLFREINERSTNGDETLLSVSEYYGVKPRKDVIDPGDFITNAASLEGYKKCQKNDLVMNIMLAWKGALGITDYDGIVSPSYNVYRPLKPRDAKYFHYLFRTKVYADIFRNNSTGIIDSRLRLYPDSFASVKVIRPPLEDQISICKFLDVQLRRVEELTHSHEKMIRLLKQKRQAIITHAVTKGLDPNVPMKDSRIEWIGEIPANWNIKRLKYAAQLVTEKSRQYAKRVALENVESWSGRYINTETKFEGEGVEFREGDVLFGKLRPYLAKVYKAEFSGSAVGEFFVLRPYFDIDSDFLSALLLNREFINLVDGSTYGAKMPRVDWEFMGNLLLAIPPTTEQRNIFEIIDAKTSKIDYLISKQQQMIELLQEHKTSLISQAVTGKIDVRSLSQEVKETAGQTP